jgi:hypothetical protein
MPWNSPHQFAVETPLIEGRSYQVVSRLCVFSCWMWMSADHSMETRSKITVSDGSNWTFKMWRQETLSRPLLIYTVNSLPVRTRMHCRKVHKARERHNWMVKHESVGDLSSVVSLQPLSCLFDQRLLQILSDSWWSRQKLVNGENWRKSMHCAGCCDAMIILHAVISIFGCFGSCTWSRSRWLRTSSPTSRRNDHDLFGS